jgi:hypothetical protein
MLELLGNPITEETHIDDMEFLMWPVFTMFCLAFGGVGANVMLNWCTSSALACWLLQHVRAVAILAVY